MGRYTYYAASYWRRDCEPSSIAVCLVPTNDLFSDQTYSRLKALRTAIDAAMVMGREFCLLSGCGCDYENEPDTAGCPICKPDLVWSGVHPHSARNLFTAAELREHRRDLLAGNVVWLDRG